MHRQRTRLAARINRVAKTFEFRGIIATYKLHDRLLTNQAARRRFQRSTPGLDVVQRRVLQALKTDGYALLPFSELVPDTSLWEALEQEGDRFAGATAEGLRQEAAGESSGLRRTGKDFVVRRDAYGSRIRLDDPWRSVLVRRRLVAGRLGLFAGLGARRPHLAAVMVPVAHRCAAGQRSQRHRQ